MIYIKLTEEQLRSELGTLKLYRVKWKDRFGEYKKDILAKDYESTERKARDVFKMSGELNINSINEYVYF